jgi:L-ascorbate metabolism protein UlaG (beta-lactamase superfamily)
MVPMHYGTFPLGNEAPHEPVQRLLADARRRAFAERVKVMEEGIPDLF